MPQLDFSTFANSVLYLYSAWVVVLLLVVVLSIRVSRLMSAMAFKKYSVFGSLIRLLGSL